MFSAIAIIPARGGSKRIPRKNIRSFLGTPIIGYSIEAALKSGIFDEVMVSTDDEEIRDVAIKLGAKVPFMRKKELAGDFATTDQVVLDVLSEYKKQGKEFRYAACIYPTAPFISAEALIEAVEIMKKFSPTEVMPVIPFSYPPQRCFIVDEKGNATFKNPEYIQTRSQDLEKMYHDVGQYYIYDTAKFIANEGIITKDIRVIVLSEREAQDIDTEEDWKLAELKYSLFRKE